MALLSHLPYLGNLEFASCIQLEPRLPACSPARPLAACTPAEALTVCRAAPQADRARKRRDEAKANMAAPPAAGVHPLLRTIITA